MMNDDGNKAAPNLKGKRYATDSNQYPTKSCTTPQLVTPNSSVSLPGDNFQSLDQTSAKPIPISSSPSAGRSVQDNQFKLPDLARSYDRAPDIAEPSGMLAWQFSRHHLDTQEESSLDAWKGPQPAKRSNALATTQHASLDAPSQVMTPSQRTREPLGAFVEAPQRNPQRFGRAANDNQKICSQVASDFFKNGVKRVREGNQRQVVTERRLQEPNQNQLRQEKIWAAAGQKEGQYLRFLRTKEAPENYQTLKIIGRGAFGEVKLVRKLIDGKVYAMKSLIKTEMLRRDQLAHVRAERDILAEAESPWVVKLFTTFQDSHFLYMLMEYLPGGDLMTMLIKYQIFSHDITRFYMAECIQAIEAVHSLGFIHRDIKPDNILLDRKGHIKLTDFGLSTGFHRLHNNSYYKQLLEEGSSRLRDRNSIAIDQINLTISNRSQINGWRRSRRLAYSNVGTPDYTAPEILTGQGYSFSCDWWSLGTIMFECLIGWPPFCAESPYETYHKSVNWRHTLFFPNDVQISTDAKHLIRSLVCDPEDRLGRGGSQELKQHAFFRGVDFDGLRSIGAPFEPRLTSDIDTSNFPIDEISQVDNAALIKEHDRLQLHPEKSLDMSLPFLGYTYKRFDQNFR